MKKTDYVKAKKFISDCDVLQQEIKNTSQVLLELDSECLFSHLTIKVNDTEIDIAKDPKVRESLKEIVQDYYNNLLKQFNELEL